MTGDRTEVAKEVANAIGIQNVFAELTPAQKSDKIKRLRQDGKLVAMVCAFSSKRTQDSYANIFDAPDR
jgi:cation transport ATPase